MRTRSASFAYAAGEKLVVMVKKKYIVTLTPPERQQLEELTKKGKAAADKVNHARMKAVS